MSLDGVDSELPVVPAILELRRLQLLARLVTPLRVDLFADTRMSKPEVVTVCRYASSLRLSSPIPIQSNIRVQTTVRGV